MEFVHLVPLMLVAWLYPQDAQDTSAAWWARAKGAANTELEGLFDELERAATLDTDPSRGWRIPLVWTSIELMHVPEDVLHGEKDLMSRVKRARSLAERYGAGIHRLSVELNYADILFEQHGYVESRNVLARASEAYPEPSRGLAMNLDHQAQIALILCDYAEGERLGLRSWNLCEQLLVPARRNGDREEQWVLLTTEVRVLGERAQAAESLGLPDRAAFLLDDVPGRLREIESLISDNGARITASCFLVQFEYDVEDYDGVIDTVEQTLALEPPPLPDERRFLDLMKGLALYSSDRKSAEDTRQAVAMLTALAEGPDTMSDVPLYAMLTLVDSGLDAGKLEVCQKWLARIDQTLAPRAAIPDCCPSTNFETTVDVLKVDAALAAGQSKPNLERLRARLLADYSAFIEFRTNIPPEPGGVGFLHATHWRRVISSLIRVELALDDSEQGVARALDAVLRAQELGTFGQSIGAPHVGLEDLRRDLLDSDTGLLVFFPEAGHSHLFVVDGRHARHFELPPRSDLEPAISEFSAVVSTAPERADGDWTSSTRARRWLESGRTLRALLLPDDAIADIHRWTGFYVSGTEYLKNVSLECLPWTDERALGVERSIAYLPSLPVGVWLSRRQRAQRDTGSSPELFVFGAPTTSEGFAQPPFELDNGSRALLAEAFGETHSRFLTGADATISKLCATSSLHPTLLECFTHGTFDFRRTYPAGLLVTPEDGRDNVLWTEDILGRLEAPPLVGLFACGSALGPTRTGDDTATQLGNAFLAKGSDVVLLCRERASYGAMLELASAFNRAIVHDPTRPGEALRAARERLASGSRWKDVFYHGHVSLLGLSQRPSDEPRTSTGSLNRAASSTPSTGSIVWIAAAGAALIALVLRAVRLRRPTEVDAPRG